MPKAATPKAAHKVKVSVSLSPALLARLDERAKTLELSRSTLLQIAVREYLAK